MAEIEKLEARVREQKSRFAGWFCELNSAMSYRLWEQGGEDCDLEYSVPLYESECGLSHDEALALLAVVRAAKNTRDQFFGSSIELQGLALSSLRAALAAFDAMNKDGENAT